MGGGGLSSQLFYLGPKRSSSLGQPALRWSLRQDRAMKKTFSLEHAKIKPARMGEAVRGEIKKYVKRERRKALSDGVDFWDFDCRFGLTEAEAERVHLSDINKKIMAAEAEGATSFYVEILAKEGHRTKKPKPVEPGSAWEGLE